MCITNADENLDSNFNEFYWNTFADPQQAAPFYTNPTFSSPTTSTFVDFICNTLLLNLMKLANLAL